MKRKVRNWTAFLLALVLVFSMIVCFADGSSRAWDFTVNGRSTGRDSANSPIKGGDVIVWRYAGI